MKVRITDSESLAALLPLEMTAYLQSTGWTLTGYYADKATVWEKGEEVLQVPRGRHLADYARRVGEIVATLAAMEQRSQLEVYRDLSLSTSDVIRVRVVSPLAGDGSVGLEAGVVLIKSTQEMLQAAARAAVARRPAYRARLPLEAEDFLKRVRLGQTEQGSYVVTVLCPVAPELRQPENSPNEEVIPFERKVTTLLANGLERTTQAASDASVLGDSQPFLDAVPFGVSANLCEALACMGELVEDGEVEIGFTWSRSRTAPAVRSSRLVVPRELIPWMREAGRVLRDQTWDGDLEVEGLVVGLKRDNPVAIGEVTLKTPWRGGWRKVVLWLPSDKYEQATAAHQTGQTVFAQGVILRQGRNFVMEKAESFFVQPDERT